MSEKIKKYIKMLIASLGAVIIVIVCMYHSSCHITPEGIVLLTDSYSCPKIGEYKVEGGEITVYFTKPVVCEECFVVEASDDKEISSIENFLQSEEKIKVSAEFDEKMNSINYRLASKTIIGKKYELYSVVRDVKGSSLSFALPFLGENDHLAGVVISEINEAYSKKDDMCEYIELYVYSGGNLFGLELISASDGKKFELPAVEVNKGEYIVVHLRKNEDNKNQISELDNNLNLSRARGSVNGARDIWIKNTDSCLSGSADIVLLNNKAKNEIIDCLMYCKKEYADSNDNWKTEALIQTARQCVDLKLWSGEGKPSDAVFSTERKSISNISRKNISSIKSENLPLNNSKCWTGTTRSKMSPGRANRW